MFLKPTAKPTPRCTPSPRVVLPAPPGSRIASRGSLSARGTGSAAACRITSATGSVPSIAWPVGSTSPGCERIQQPELDGIDPELRGELVELCLRGEARLDGAEAAHRPAGRVVRIDARRLDQRVLDGIGPEREGGRVRGDGRRARGVGAAVEQDSHPDVDELPGPRRPVLAPDPGGMPVDVADEGLLAVVDDLDGAARAQREQRAVDLHREILAATECAADAAQVDPHHLRRQREARRDLVAVDVQPLRGDMDVDPALAVGNGESRLRSEERLILDPDLVDAGDGDLALGLRIAVPDQHRANDVRARIVAIAVAPASLGIVGRSGWSGSCSSARSISVTGSSGS